MKPGKKILDVIVVGGGPAGCSAAILLARCKRTVLIIDEGQYRNRLSKGMHNFPTRDGVLPADYIDLTRKELKTYGVAITKGKAIKAKKLSKTGFEIKDGKGNIYLCRRLLLATGVKDNIPEIPGMHELWGCSVFHCPYCDGWECRDLVIGLYAQKHNGYGMALALRQLSKKVILFTDGAYYLKPGQKANLLALHVPVVSRRVNKLVYEGEKLNSIELQSGETINCNAMFILHGHKVNSDLLLQLGCNCMPNGAAITNRHQKTNVPGVYVAGDASIDSHMVVVAAAEGAKAGIAIHNDLLHADNLIQ